MLLALLNARALKDRLRRPLHGSPDPLMPTGEHAVVAAAAKGRLDSVRAALAAGEAAGTRLGDDFVRLVSRLLVANDPTDDRTPVKRFEVDIPMPVWHEIARQARIEGRPLRRVIADYLLRGWDEAHIARHELLDARVALREELAAMRGEIAALRDDYRRLRHP